MKKFSSSITARIAVGAIFAASSAFLSVFAFTVNSRDVAAAPAKVNSAKEPVLLAKPEGYFALLQKFPKLRATRPAAPAAVTAPAAVPPAPVDPGPKLGFENFEGPGVLTPVVTTSQGQAVNSVEYIAHDAGEPSIGVNWNSPAPNNINGVTAFQSDLQTLFVTFDDSCNLTKPKSTWVNRPAPTSQGANQDPIGTTDRVTGRTFAAQLTLTSPTCKTSYTDDDGLTWTPALGFGIGSGIDHQTIGGGPYHGPVPQNTTPYPHAIYYCSQLPQSACARSDDGGLTFGPVVPIDPVGDAHCQGIHGHVKVAPDGSVYVPMNNCDGAGSVIVSETNGITWTIRHVTGTTSSGIIIDPQVAIDDGGKVYFAMANGDGTAVVATSIDHGVSWQNLFDVGAVYGVKTTIYPYAVAADSGRAAVAFLGSIAPGDGSANGLGTFVPAFNGVWHLYVASTFDGGAHWTTTDATPNDPLQRGCIWAHGGADICRNLLDFIGMTIDKQGRIEVGYVDGCTEGDCAQAAINPDGTSGVKGNGYTARGVIARQSSGRRMVAPFDPPSPTSVPGMPSVTARRVNGVVHLAWSLADSGNLMINNYQILRGIASGVESSLTTVAGTQIGGTYDDLTATDTTKTYFYKVVANNSAGSSCANNEVPAPYLGNTCQGFVLQKTPPNHPEQTTQGQTPASLAIDYIAVAEPPATNYLVFTMKVTNMGATPPPDSRWRIVWNWPTAPGQQYYAGMRTDAAGVATFDYGHVATAVVGLVLGVPTETKDGNGAAGSGFTPDGTIMVVVPKSAVGNPQPGDLLGAVNGRTFTGDTPETNTLQRSNLLMDHTFAKAQRDNGHPAATYTIVGNTACSAGQIVPISAVSRKHHANAGDFDVNLPLTGPVGIEDRSGGQTGDHTVVITFAAPVTFSNATVTPGAGGTASISGSPAVNGSEVTVNLTNVSNAQTLTINLLGVSDGTNTGNVGIPMGVLGGDTNEDRFVNSADISQTKSQSGQSVTVFNYREDVNVDGFLNSADITFVKSKSGTALP